MNLPTQTMETTTEVEYISIYELRKPSGRPKGSCKLSDEERREKVRLKSKNIMTETLRKNVKERD